MIWDVVFDVVFYVVWAFAMFYIAKTSTEDEKSRLRLVVMCVSLTIMADDTNYYFGWMDSPHDLIGVFVGGFCTLGLALYFLRRKPQEIVDGMHSGHE